MFLKRYKNYIKWTIFIFGISIFLYTKGLTGYLRSMIFLLEILWINKILKTEEEIIKKIIYTMITFIFGIGFLIIFTKSESVIKTSLTLGIIIIIFSVLNTLQKKALINKK